MNKPPKEGMLYIEELDKWVDVESIESNSRKEFMIVVLTNGTIMYYEKVFKLMGVME